MPDQCSCQLCAVGFTLWIISDDNAGCSQCPPSTCKAIFCNSCSCKKFLSFNRPGYSSRLVAIVVNFWGELSRCKFIIPCCCVCALQEYFCQPVKMQFFLKNYNTFTGHGSLAAKGCW